MTYETSAFKLETTHNATFNVGTAAIASAVGIGSDVVYIAVDGRSQPINLTNVLHVPYFKCQLVSVPLLASLAVSISFTQRKCALVAHGATIATGTLNGRLYQLDTVRTMSTRGVVNLSNNPISSREVSSSLVTAVEHSQLDVLAVPSWASTSPYAVTRSRLQLWHGRLAHVAPSTILSMVKHSVVKMLTTPTSLPLRYHEKVSTGERNSIEISDLIIAFGCEVLSLVLVHKAVAGPISVPTPSRSSFFVNFIDDHSQWVTIFTMPSKYDTFSNFKLYQTLTQIHIGSQIQYLRSENEGKYLPSDFQAHLVNHDIHHERTVPHTR